MLLIHTRLQNKLAYLLILGKYLMETLVISGDIKIKIIIVP